VPLIAVVVGGVARLEVRRQALLVDALKVLGQECHSEPATGVSRMRAEQAQVVVGLVPRLGGVEPLEQLEHLSRARPHEIPDEWLDPFVVLLGQLRAAGRDPDGSGLTSFGDAHPRVPHRARDQKPPEDRVLRLPATSVRERPAPRRVLVEGKADGLGHRIEIGVR
jgi:hypothetical protein